MTPKEPVAKRPAINRPGLAPNPLWYREAVIYGYYLWSITRRVDPPIINLFVGRLGAAVTRHQTHALLGIA